MKTQGIFEVISVSNLVYKSSGKIFLSEGLVIGQI